MFCQALTEGQMVVLEDICIHFCHPKYKLLSPKDTRN